MQSAPQEERGTRVVAVHPNAHVLAGFPCTPHSSLLQFLRGEPKVLGAVQILLALITVGFGITLAMNSILFSKAFPLVVLTAYPFWGPAIFIVTGCLSMKEKNSKKLRQSVMTMSITSALAAAAGITFTIISCTQHKFCQNPSLDGPCAIGRTLLLGLLSILFIISIVEFSISVTITSFRSKCWTWSDEVVFFLPSDAIKSSEQPAPENAQLQFDHQKESYSFHMPPQAEIVFFGGYAFCKLRYSRSPSSQNRPQPNREGAPPSPNEQQENISSHVQFSHENTELKPLFATSEARSPENMHTHQASTRKQLRDEGLNYPIVHTPKEQAWGFQDQDSLWQAFPSPVAENLLMKDPPIQDVQSRSPSFRITEPSDLIYENSSSKDKPPQGKPSQAVPAQDMLNVASTFHPMKLPNSKYPLQLSPNSKEQNIERRSQQSEVIYQDIVTEVMELTQQWQSPRRLSSDAGNVGAQSSKSRSLGLQTKHTKSPRRKSLDQKIRALLFSKMHPIDKKSQYTQTSEQFLDQQAEDREAKGVQSPKQQSKNEGNTYQQAKKEQSPKKQTYGQQAEEKSPKGQPNIWQTERPHTQVEDAPKQSYQDSQGTIKQSPRWSAPDSQSFVQKSQDLLQKEALKKKGLYQEVETQNTTAQHDLGWQLQNKQFQEKDQDCQSGMMLTNAMQTRDINLAGVNHRDQKPIDTQSEDTEPAYRPSSSQSVVQDTDLTCLSHMDSEQEVQQSTSVCSGCTKDDMNTQSTSSSLKDDQQQSEDSD
ncbi:PREDICTED: membrane-spanning 4-domains subfamily A member 14 isoform X2 [Chinchilla lanigera]|uniref:membrane-spanning 4-domains subfamily A member 14 isoform X2 n=1 Tax=Chinchilla lanigera TaxID=34839 RepID=UPI00038F00B6|nr:PREDICTED: membrane-spanning 4-domains subfamily A member 14 isoform X2 [Chinchilla lanigera]